MDKISGTVKYCVDTHLSDTYQYFTVPEILHSFASKIWRFLELKLDKSDLEYLFGLIEPIVFLRISISKNNVVYNDVFVLQRRDRR